MRFMTVETGHYRMHGLRALAAGKTLSRLRVRPKGKHMAYISLRWPSSIGNETAKYKLLNFYFTTALLAIARLDLRSQRDDDQLDFLSEREPSASGSTTIANLSLTIAGQTITFSGTPSANDVIFSLPGLTVTLNQQIPDTTEIAGITTNAIAIDFNSFAVGPNHVNGTVDIGQSMASFAVIPEPATWAMMLAGFAGLGFAGYRASRKVAA
jgi:hypothetical protein